MTKQITEEEIQQGYAAHNAGSPDLDHDPETEEMLFQFISAETGYRSEPFTSTRTQIIEILKQRKEDEAPKDEDYLLLVAVMKGKETYIPTAPLITVKHLLDISE